ncbi:tetraacyldisaccharide 4'-kinase [Ranunculus cassubicifolius]
MEETRRLVNKIAYTPTQNFPSLSPLHRSLIPLLSFTSSIYKLALLSRHHLYNLGFFTKHKLPVPVISVGNLSWGGNGKTPMVQFLAIWFHQIGITPLVLTRGYGGGDEATMLKRHLLSTTSARIGVGANRFATAACIFKQQGYRNSAWTESPKHDSELRSSVDKIGVVLLDDGMQHWSLYRDVDIVMVNGMKPWGNNQLLPLGPLREPVAALKRADVVVIHHADLVAEKELKAIEFIIREEQDGIPIFRTSLSPSCFFEVNNCDPKLPLNVMHNLVVLCVSAIGSPDAFVRGIEKLGPLYVDRIDFSDHYIFQAKDIQMIKERLEKLHDEYGYKPVVTVTEKDYDRDPVILKDLRPFEVLVLCSHLQILPSTTYTQERFQNSLKQLVKRKFSAR